MDHITMEFTPKELQTLQNMLQDYRLHEEELYSRPDPTWPHPPWNGEEENLFTETQRQLFTRFDVTSVTFTKS